MAKDGNASLYGINGHLKRWHPLSTTLKQGHLVTFLFLPILAFWNLYVGPAHFSDWPDPRGVLQVKEEQVGMRKISLVHLEGVGRETCLLGGYKHLKPKGVLGEPRLPITPTGLILSL